MIALLLLAVLFPGRAAAATVPAPVGSGGLTLELSQVTPRVVTATSPAAVTVVGTLRNTGDRPVSDLEVRLQRGDTLLKVDWPIEAAADCSAWLRDVTK